MSRPAPAADPENRTARPQVIVHDYARPPGYDRAAPQARAALDKAWRACDAAHRAYREAFSRAGNRHYGRRVNAAFARYGEALGAYGEALAAIRASAAGEDPVCQAVEALLSIVTWGLDDRHRAGVTALAARAKAILDGHPLPSDETGQSCVAVADGPPARDGRGGGEIRGDARCSVGYDRDEALHLLLIELVLGPAAGTSRSASLAEAISEARDRFIAIYHATAGANTDELLAAARDLHAAALPCQEAWDPGLAEAFAALSVLGFLPASTPGAPLHQQAPRPRSRTEPEGT